MDEGIPEGWNDPKETTENDEDGGRDKKKKMGHRSLESTSF